MSEKQKPEDLDEQGAGPREPKEPSTSDVVEPEAIIPATKTEEKALGSNPKLVQGALPPPAVPTVVLTAKQNPVTVDGYVNIGMGQKVWLPSEKEQRAGFRPAAVIDGKDADGTDLILTTFQGRYKSLTAKG